MSRLSASVALVVGAIALGASAQSISGGCQQALLGIASDAQASACLSPSSLITVIAGGTQSSIVKPIDGWLTTICSAPACSNATLSAISANLTSGCSAELTSFNIGDPATFNSTLLQAYPYVRRVACLKQGNTLCITQELQDIEAASGTLNLNAIIGIVSGQNNTIQIPQNVTCSDCNKATYNILNQGYPTLEQNAKPALQANCGASFLDGASPSGVVETASTSTAAAAGSSNNNAALGALSLVSPALAGVGMALFLSASTVFTFLL